MLSVDLHPISMSRPNPPTPCQTPPRAPQSAHGRAACVFVHVFLVVFDQTHVAHRRRRRRQTQQEDLVEVQSFTDVTD